MHNSKNIWYVCKYAAPYAYSLGTRHFSFGLNWTKNGHKVTVFTSNSSHKRKKLPQFSGWFKLENHYGVDTVWLKMPKFKTSSSFMRIISWFLFEFSFLFLNKKRFKKPDVIIASSLSLFTVWSVWLLSKWHNAIFIFEVRDIWPLSAQVLGKKNKYHPLIVLMSVTERFGYRQADVIIGTMPNLVEHVKNISPKSAHKVHCVPQPWDEAFYSKMQEELPEGYLEKYLKSEKFKICYAGAISFNNPLDQLLDAAKNLNCEVLIVGDGRDKKRLMEKYSNFPNIRFLPPVKKSQVQAILREVDLCYDSIYSEIGNYGLSRNKWIDYMMAGKPIICALEGYPSMINEAQSGTFVGYSVKELKNELQRYIDLDREELYKIGMRGKTWLLKNQSSERLSKLYEQYFEKNN